MCSPIHFPPMPLAFPLLIYLLFQATLRMTPLFSHPRPQGKTGHTYHHFFSILFSQNDCHWAQAKLQRGDGGQQCSRKQKAGNISPWASTCKNGVKNMREGHGVLEGEGLHLLLGLYTKHPDESVCRTWHTSHHCPFGPGNCEESAYGTQYRGGAFFYSIGCCGAIIGIQNPHHSQCSTSNCNVYLAFAPTKWPGTHGTG